MLCSAAAAFLFNIHPSHIKHRQKRGWVRMVGA
jgi:hypothetical protein